MKKMTTIGEAYSSALLADAGNDRIYGDGATLVTNLASSCSAQRPLMVRVALGPEKLNHACNERACRGPISRGAGRQRYARRSMPA
jgi:hypothetical protein